MPSPQASKKFYPPRLTLLLLKMMAGSKDLEYVTGDLTETFEYLVEHQGNRSARRWFWKEIIKSFPGFARNALFWKMSMLFNLFKITVRNIRRHKAYSFINMAGLSVGIALFGLIVAFIGSELSHNTFHARYKRIYQVGTGENNGTAAPMARLLKSRFPEIEQAVRFRNNFHSQLFRYKGDFFKIEEMYFVDPEVFEVFTFPIIKGDAQTALRDPYSLVLTQSEAIRIFDSEDPIGKIVNYDNQQDFTVTAVIQDVPSTSSLSFQALFPMKALGKVTEESQGWNQWSCQTYLLFPEAHDVSLIEEKIRGFLHGVYEKQWGMTQLQIQNRFFSLRAFKDLYFDIFRGGRFKHGSLQNIYIFGIVAVIILLIACVNFINLTTARSSIRAKEISIRKVLGSRKKQIFIQFLFESVFLSYAAAGFACVLYWLVKSAVEGLIQKDLGFGFLSLSFQVLFFLSGPLFVGALSGIYPAFYLAAFRPSDIFNGRIAGRTQRAVSRKTLAGFQFAVSVILIFGTLTVTHQLHFMNQKDLGFRKDHLLWFEMSHSLYSQADVFRQKLLAYPGIEGASWSRFTRPGISGTWDFRYGSNEVKSSVFLTDAEFINTMGLDIVLGRDFSPALISGTGKSVILNETAVEAFGMESPIGQTIRVSVPYTVVGVIKDYYFQSLHHEIKPLALVYDPAACNIANLRISSRNVPQTLANIERAWLELSPDHPFVFSFFENSYDRLYRSEERFQKLFLYFAFLAIFIAGLGLLGLSTHLIEQRTKEIGIRKVLGASVFGIVGMLCHEVIWVIGIANLVAWPIAWFGLSKWLQNFAYRVPLSGWTLVLTAGLVFGLALLTVSSQAFKAAEANPQDSLRYE